MASLDNQLIEVCQEESRIPEKIDRRNERKSIQCSGCDNHHKIGDITAVQTHWGYGKEGGLEFVCPETGIINRLLFNNDDVPWEERKLYENNPEEQFKRNYKKLFKEVVNDYDTGPRGKWVNNYYVDENRRKFGLVERSKSS